MTSFELGIDMQQAEALIEKYISDPITKLHLIETEAIMRALAKRLGENEEKWGLAGILHDIDWDQTKKENPSQHTVKCIKILKKAGASDFLVEAVISHVYGHDAIPEHKEKKREGRLQHSLVAAETLTGLIIASALVQPDKKLASLKLSSLKKKFKQKAFAANCNRELISECEKAGIPEEEFLEIGLKALQNISDKLGL